MNSFDCFVIDRAKQLVFFLVVIDSLFLLECDCYWRPYVLPAGVWCTRVRSSADQCCILGGWACVSPGLAVLWVTTWPSVSPHPQVSVIFCLGVVWRKSPTPACQIDWWVSRPDSECVSWHYTWSVKQSETSFPINMPDPIRNGFGFGQLWPLWPVCSQNWAGSYMPDPTSHFCFCKEDPDHVVQNWSGSDLDDLVRFWANTSGPEVNWYARIVGPRFWQNTTGPLPVSHFQTCLLSLTDGLEHIVQNCLDPVWFWLTVSCFLPNGSCLEESRCARIIWPFLANASELIWIRSSMFTGLIQLTSFKGNFCLRQGS